MEIPIPFQGTPQSPDLSPMAPEAAALSADLRAAVARVSALERQLQELKGSLNNPRVRIQNFEGVFKAVSTAPSNSDDYQDGSVVLYDDGSSTRRIYTKINKTWRYATLT